MGASPRRAGGTLDLHLEHIEAFRHPLYLLSSPNSSWSNVSSVTVPLPSLLPTETARSQGSSIRTSRMSLRDSRVRTRHSLLRTADFHAPGTQMRVENPAPYRESSKHTRI